MEPGESEAQPRIQCFQRESVVFVKLVVEELFGIVWSVTLDELILTCFAVVWTTEAVQCNAWWNIERVRQGTKRIIGRTQDALMFKRESAVFDKRVLNWEFRLNLRQTWQTRINNICLPRKWDIYKTNVLFQVSDSVSLGFIHNLLLCSWCFFLLQRAH